MLGNLIGLAGFRGSVFAPNTLALKDTRRHPHPELGEIEQPMSHVSQFIETLEAALHTERKVALPPEDAILLQTQDKPGSERFFFRNFARCSFPANLYDQRGMCQIDRFGADPKDAFPAQMRMPQEAATGCAFVVADDHLYFLYDRMDRWSDAPGHLAFVAVRIEAERIVALSDHRPDIRLTKSEYLLLAHLMTGLDLKKAAMLLGASYDTKRKQVQVIQDKLGLKTQTALLRALSVDITARILDEVLPTQQRNFETALVKRQFGKDVIVNMVTIGEGLEVPVWEFGARRGRPVLYFHSMLAPIAFHPEMSSCLNKLGLRLLIVPRHFMGFDGVLDAETRLTKLTRALADTMDYLTDEPLICLGESAGVPWLAHFARHNPDLVSHVILAATPQPAHPHPAPSQDHGDSPTLFVEISNRLRRDARVIAGLTRVYNAISRVPMFAQKALAHMYRKSPADLACLENLFRHPHLCEWLRLIANHATLASVDELTNLQRNWPKDLRALQCGVTFVHGLEDPISPIDDIRSIAQTLPDAAFHAVENAGHLIFTQHFKDFVDHIATLTAPAPSAPNRA